MSPASRLKQVLALAAACGLGAVIGWALRGGVHREPVSSAPPRADVGSATGRAPGPRVTASRTSARVAELERANAELEARNRELQALLDAGAAAAAPPAALAAAAEEGDNPRLRAVREAREALLRAEAAVLPADKRRPFPIEAASRTTVDHDEVQWGGPDNDNVIYGLREGDAGPYMEYIAGRQAGYTLRYSPKNYGLDRFPAAAEDELRGMFRTWYEQETRRMLETRGEWEAIADPWKRHDAMTAYRKEFERRKRQFRRDVEAVVSRHTGTVGHQLLIN